LKSVIIIGSAHPLRGGLAIYNERLAKEFGDMGYEIEIYSFSLQYPKFLFPGKTQYSDEPPPKGVKIKTCVNSINPFNWIKIGREIKRRKPDLVIYKFWLPFMGPCFGTIARIFKRNKHTRVISIVDNIIPHEKRTGDRLFTKYFIKRVDGYVAMSKSVLNDIEQHFDKVKPKKYSPHPLFDNFGEIISKEQAKRNLQLDPNYKYILFFGLIRDYKGLDLFLDAFAKEEFRKLPLKIIVAGEYYTDPKPYKDQMERLGLMPHIIEKAEFITDSQVGNYFCASDLVVQPYKHATQSGVTQIAYHFNKPMIVTNVGGLPEMIPHEKVGYVVEPNANDLASAMLKFYSAEKENEFVENVKIEKEKYAWSKMVNTIEDLYSEIIKK